jgi:hypothetical protein
VTANFITAGIKNHKFLIQVQGANGSSKNTAFTLYSSFQAALRCFFARLIAHNEGMVVAA